MKTLVCYGDSLTAGFGVKRGYVSRLQDLTEDLQVVGRGQNGRSAHHMISSLEREVLSLKPDYVLILAGLNDLILDHRKPSAVVDAYEIMGTRLEEQGVEPILGLNYTPGICLNPTLKSWIPISPLHCEELVGLRELALSLCSRKQWDYIDFDGALKDGLGDRYSHYFSDGVHVIEQGHELMAEAVLRWWNWKAHSLHLQEK